MWFFVQLCSSWQDFNWLKASHGPSAIAELFVEIQRDIYRQSPSLPTSPIPRGDCVGISSRFSASQYYFSGLPCGVDCAIRSVIVLEHRLVTDRQTDRQTPSHSIYRASITSRSRKVQDRGIVTIENQKNIIYHLSSGTIAIVNVC